MIKFKTEEDCSAVISRIKSGIIFEAAAANTLREIGIDEITAEFTRANNVKRRLEAIVDEVTAACKGDTEEANPFQVGAINQIKVFAKQANDAFNAAVGSLNRPAPAPVPPVVEAPPAKPKLTLGTLAQELEETVALPAAPKVAAANAPFIASIPAGKQAAAALGIKPSPDGLRRAPGSETFSPGTSGMDLADRNLEAAARAASDDPGNPLKQQYKFNNVPLQFMYDVGPIVIFKEIGADEIKDVRYKISGRSLWFDLDYLDARYFNEGSASNIVIEGHELMGTTTSVSPQSDGKHRVYMTV